MWFRCHQRGSCTPLVDPNDDVPSASTEIRSDTATTAGERRRASRSSAVADSSTTGAPGAPRTWDLPRRAPRTEARPCATSLSNAARDEALGACDGGLATVTTTSTEPLIP